VYTVKASVDRGYHAGRVSTGGSCEQFVLIDSLSISLS